MLLVWIRMDRLFLHELLDSQSFNLPCFLEMPVVLLVDFFRRLINNNNNNNNNCRILKIGLVIVESKILCNTPSFTELTGM